MEEIEVSVALEKSVSLYHADVAKLQLAAHALWMQKAQEFRLEEEWYLDSHPDEPVEKVSESFQTLLEKEKAVHRAEVQKEIKQIHDQLLIRNLQILNAVMKTPKKKSN